jgi:hypothetical protein
MTVTLATGEPRLLLQKKTPDFQAKPADDFVRTLSDSELLDRCVQGFKKLRELIPYLREARRALGAAGSAGSRARTPLLD